ncbi:MAG: hypothetical protein II870_07560, partial [Synergistaceae bacterium]|nr:hypothetical protein [Synergistaceae bacterium]
MLLGILFSFADAQTVSFDKSKKFIWYGLFAGVLAGFALFFIRLSDPKGMNLILIAFNRRLIIFIAANAILALSFALILSFNKFNKILNLIMSL